MMHVIEWLNTNQGFIMSLLTLVYVIATIVIVYYNRKSINELKLTRESENRPYLFAYLHKDPRDMCFYFRIKNYGKTGALIENILITPKLKFVYNKNTDEFLKNVVLAPQQMLQFIVLEKSDVTLKNSYTVNLEYTPVYSKKINYTQTYTLDIQYAHQMGYTENTSSNKSDEANALQNIANYLDSIRNKM